MRTISHPAVAVVLVVVMLLAGCVREEPALPDADGDQLADVHEREGWNVTVRAGSIPCPPPDGHQRENVTYHVTSNVYVDDNDTDGLLDVNEFLFRTDPNVADTDGDGLSDKQEWDLRQEEDALLRPARLSGGDVDSDEDCLSDFEEVEEGFFVERLDRMVHPDPTDADGDRDGWTDWEEIFVRATDPTDPDTDADGVRDPQDLDPHRDVAVAYRILEIRVDTAGVERVRFFGNLAQASLESDAFAVEAGQWSAVPDGEIPVPIDVKDQTASQFFEVAVSWFEANDDGTIESIDVSPADESTARLQVHAANETWRVLEGSEYSEPGHVCELEGPDGAFRFDLRIGAVGDDPGSWPTLCGT